MLDGVFLDRRRRCCLRCVSSLLLCDVAELREDCEEACRGTVGDEERVVEAEPNHVVVDQIAELWHLRRFT